MDEVQDTNKGDRTWGGVLKKVLSIVIIILLLVCGNVFAQSKIFLEAKGVALSLGRPNESGNYFAGKEDQGIKYTVGWLPFQKCIGIMVSQNNVICLVMWDGDTNMYEAFLIKDNQIVDQKIINEADALKFAERVLIHFRINV